MSDLKPNTHMLSDGLRIAVNLLRTSQAFNSCRIHCDYPPSFLAVEVTSRCNLNCIMCPRGEMSRPQGDMSLSLFRRIVDEARDFPLRAMYVQLFLRPCGRDLSQLISRLRKAFL